MFGSNSPRLTRLILEELKREESFTKEGLQRVVQMDPSEYAPAELTRKEAADAIKFESDRIENEKKAKALHERRTEVGESILAALGMFGVVLILPHAKDEAVGVLAEFWDSAGLKVRETAKIRVAENMLEELQYFSDYKIPDDSLDHLVNDVSLVQLIKSSEDLPNMEEVISEIVYGASKCPPGAPDSPAATLTKTMTAIIEKDKDDEDEAVEEEEEVELIGLWTPTNPLTKAMALKFFFPKHSEQHIPPEPEPTPPYVAVCYDAYKRHEILALQEQFPKAIMRFGFFTDEVPENAKLIAKSLPNFEIKKASEAT